MQPKKMGNQMIDLENDRLSSEIKRNEAETNKLIAETKEIRNITKNFLKYTIMGVVAAGLLSVWLVEYFQPLLYKNNEIAKLENRAFELKNTIEQYELKQKANLIAEDNIKIKNELINLIEKNKTLGLELQKATQLSESLSSNLKESHILYTSLSKKLELTAKEREHYAALAKQSEKDVSALNHKIAQLESSRIATSTQTDKLEAKLKETIREENSRIKESTIYDPTK